MATATVNKPAGSRARHAAFLPGALAARAAILIAAAGLTLPIVRTGAGVWLTREHPERAAAASPRDARILIAAARDAIDRGATPKSARVRAWVAAGLARDLTEPALIELRALDRDAAGDHAGAAQLFALSDTISRRSLPTHLWLIQHAVDRGDVAGALGQFDLALRTSTAAPGVLFPVLARASEDPTLTGKIAAILDRPSDWRVPFLHYAIEKADAADGAAAIMLRMHDRAMLRAEKLDQALIGGLIAAQEFDLALRVHDSFAPVLASAALIRDPGFTQPAMGFPFGWGLADSGETMAERGVSGGRPALLYRSMPGGFGDVATQILLLAPGTYRFRTRTAQPALDSGANPYWTITCSQEDGPQLALIEQPRQKDATGEADFTVPEKCPAQVLALILRQSDTPDQGGAIAAVEIERR